jgi:group I intron endonuclease
MQVYLVTNLINGKKYVGQTIQTLKKRWSSHGSDAKRNRGPHALVHALMKYGKQNFSIKTLRWCNSRKELNRMEKFYISKLNTKAPEGYNITDGGDGTQGVPYTAVQLKKFRKTIGDSRKGSGNSFFGKNHTEKTKKHLSEVHKKPWSRKRRAAHKPKEWKHGTSYSYKKIGCRCDLCKQYRKDLHIRTGN